MVVAGELPVLEDLGTAIQYSHLTYQEHLAGGDPQVPYATQSRTFESCVALLVACRSVLFLCVLLTVSSP